MVQQEGHKSLGVPSGLASSTQGNPGKHDVVLFFETLLTSLQDCSLQASPIPLLLRKTTISAR